MTNRPWAEAIPELVIAAVIVIVTAGAGYATAAWAGLGVAAIAAAALAAVVLRFLLPRGAPETAPPAQEKPTARPLSGYSHRKFVVRTGIEQRGFYDFELRPVLEHLLAARLAERHGINLYQDPAAARRLLCRSRGDAALWQWIDPDPQHRELNAAASDRRGIPRHILARLIDRLEKL
ncbi:MAG TPA: hypothetical protein VF070_18490 [Streptosporangiaceae bacterium]